MNVPAGACRLLKKRLKKQGLSCGNPRKEGQELARAAHTVAGIEGGFGPVGIGAPPIGIFPTFLMIGRISVAIIEENARARSAPWFHGSKAQERTAWRVYGNFIAFIAKLDIGVLVAKGAAQLHCQAWGQDVGRDGRFHDEIG